MFNIAMLNEKEIAKLWEKAEIYAMDIWEATYLKGDKKEACKKQVWLKAWLEEAREAGLVYNGVYDEYVAMAISPNYTIK